MLKEKLKDYPKTRKFKPVDIVGVPHPYCITPKHVEYCNGILDKASIERVESQGARCGVRGCQLSYAEHEQAVLIEVDDKRELEDVPELQEYLLSIKKRTEADGFVGYAFKRRQTEAEKDLHRTVGMIANEGQGGFLNPPTHPEHTQSFRGGGSYMSLTSALEEEWIHSETKKQIQEILDNWKRPEIESAEIQDWICHVMGYFKSCYSPVNGDRDVSKCLIKSKWNPLKHQSRHLGVLLIRKYYPDFKLKADHVQGAYWGTKPQ